MTNIETLLKLLAEHGGKIVSTASLEPEWIEQARASGRLYVDQHSLGYVWEPDIKQFPKTIEEVEFLEKWYPLPVELPERLKDPSFLFKSADQSPQPDKEPESQREIKVDPHEIAQEKAWEHEREFNHTTIDLYDDAGKIDGKCCAECDWMVYDNEAPTSAKTDKEIEELAEAVMLKHIPNGCINLKGYEAEKKAIIAAMIEMHKAK